MEVALIYCITQPLEKYNQKVSGFTVGLWNSYKDKPALFSLISLMSPLLYQWEKKSPVPTMEKIVRLTPEDELACERYLDTAVEGIRISNMLEIAKNPLDFFVRFRPELIATAARHYCYTPTQLDMILKARVLSWMREHNIDPWKSWEFNYKEDERLVKENAYGTYARG